jgi:hypothetical protein
VFWPSALVSESPAKRLGLFDGKSKGIVFKCVVSYVMGHNSFVFEWWKTPGQKAAAAAATVKCF